MKGKEEFTKYETTRIIGARALQISMDAPLLIKIADADLASINYDPIRIAEREFDSGVLPITIVRPLPQKREGKLKEVKEEKIDDEAIIAKEKEIEQEMTESALEQGFVEEEDTDAGLENTSAGEE